MGKSRNILSARSEVMLLMDVGLVDLPGPCTDEAFSPPRDCQGRARYQASFAFKA